MIVLKTTLNDEIFNLQTPLISSVWLIDNNGLARKISKLKILWKQRHLHLGCPWC